ncbi:MAG TPA: type I polyketide synthase [Nitriliruptorales bacterium]|nr:type I polyketide synthase [Nitriliruptorales bacterium]
MNTGGPTPIAVTGVACRYPDVSSPEELWDVVLTRRRTFRPIPPERLDLSAYVGPDGADTDRTYARYAAVLRDWDFDRVGFKVSGRSFRSADLSHWLALEVASAALADAGFPTGDGLPRPSTGVIVGNTLTGEFSRANLVRLRWPYVARTLSAALAEAGWAPRERAEFVGRYETTFKAPFPEITEETLAGGLSNTIAGRICNYHDLHGGGYTVDGACAASLLAIITACNALVAGDLDVALAGGVDLSLDPFELVGFAATGALAPDRMRVYDRRSAGFWPGEGCGFVVLMRLADAVAQDRPVRAIISGWGVSSDGAGGITRPEADGQLLALARAHRRAGRAPGTVALLEGHGTGTQVGDAVELRALDALLRDGGSDRPAALGSIKANIGHTKAAAGLAGLLKAVLALEHRCLPPTTGCEQPHDILTAAAPVLRILDQPEPWPDGPARAAVSAMGFGGINTHVVLEGGEPRHDNHAAHVHPRPAPVQDHEVIAVGAADRASLLDQVRQLALVAATISFAELPELAQHLVRAGTRHPTRLALVTSSPEELAQQLTDVQHALEDGRSPDEPAAGVHVGEPTRRPRIGFLFPGQSSPTRRDGGAWSRRFTSVARLYADLLPPGVNDEDTTVAQPAIVRASLAAMRVLGELGVVADLALGHSLGELTALHWAGVMDARTLESMARARGAVMATLGAEGGGMAQVGADEGLVAGVVGDLPLAVAARNGPRRTVVSGPHDELRALEERCGRRDIAFVPLRVSHAFHSPAMAPAARAFAEVLGGLDLRPPARPVWSTITGTRLDEHAPVSDLLVRQFTDVVRFVDAVAGASDHVDVFVEVGPGRVLAPLAHELTGLPTLSTDACDASLHGLLSCLARLHCLGVDVNLARLLDDRPLRDLDPSARPVFLRNPCEDGAPGPVDGLPEPVQAPRDASDPLAGTAVPPPPTTTPDLVTLLRGMIAARAELPVDAVTPDSRMLADLHLNSIAVADLLAEAATVTGKRAPLVPGELANASVEELAAALDGSPTDATQTTTTSVHGVESWVRVFEPAWIPEEPPTAGTVTGGRVFGSAGPVLRRRLAELLDSDAEAEANPAATRTAIVCLDDVPRDDDIPALLEAYRWVAVAPSGHLVLVQGRYGSAAFARTVHLEHPHVATTVIAVPPGADAHELVLLEAAAADGHREVRYEQGVRSRAVVRPVDLSATKPVLQPADVLLVSGGGRGIAAECASHLARVSGANLLLLGRSSPEREPQLRANLERLEAQGVGFLYLVADVRDPVATARAVRQGEAELGPVTVVLHGAGINDPAPLTALEPGDFQRALHPKVTGLRNLLAATSASPVRLIVTFSSIIARLGLEGEAHYALANEWMEHELDRHCAARPTCRGLNVEWSVWSGTGMGQRLGVLNALAQRGVSAVPLDEGVAMLERLIGSDETPRTTVVASRFGQPATVHWEPRPRLPLLRFVERILVDYPGVELVVDAEVSPDTDPYLLDHRVGGVPVLPGVLALEAAAQVAVQLTGRNTVAGFENVEFLAPVTVPTTGSARIRIAALQDDADRVQVAIRSSTTDLAVDHARITVRLSAPADPGAPRLGDDALRIPVDVQVGADDLYGSLLFHGPTFRRVLGYPELRARRCTATIAGDDQRWFAPYLPRHLILGDPAARDAYIHALQACVPHRRVLPVAVERIDLLGAQTTTPLTIRAVERQETDHGFIYDLDVEDARGRTVERWRGLHLRAIEELPPPTWPSPTVGPFLERAISRSVEAGPRVYCLASPERSGLATVPASVGSAKGSVAPYRRPDGRPELAQPDLSISVAHAAGGTLLVIDRRRVGCDVEQVQQRPDGIWRGVLGDRIQLARALVAGGGLTLDEAATAVWAVGEASVKAGRPPDEVLELRGESPSALAFRAGPLKVRAWLLPGDPAMVVALASEASGHA